VLAAEASLVIAVPLPTLPSRRLRSSARACRLGQQLFLQLVYFSSARFTWEQPHEWIPLLIVALVPAGRVWGHDHRLIQRGSQRYGGWPF
jgi:hypothetical protein